MFYYLIFIIISILRFILFYIKKFNKGTPIEFMYLKTKFNLNIKKLDNTNIKLLISLIDGFIISVSIYGMLIFKKNLILMPIVGLILVFILIFIINEIVGRILKLLGFDK